MDSCELVTIVTAVSCGIAKCVPKEELPLVTAIIGQIASTLATILEQEALNAPELPELEKPVQPIAPPVIPAPTVEITPPQNRPGR